MKKNIAFVMCFVFMFSSFFIITGSAESINMIQNGWPILSLDNWVLGSNYTSNISSGYDSSNRSLWIKNNTSDFYAPNNIFFQNISRIDLKKGKEYKFSVFMTFNWWGFLDVNLPTGFDMKVTMTPYGVGAARTIAAFRTSDHTNISGLLYETTFIAEDDWYSLLTIYFTSNSSNNIPQNSQVWISAVSILSLEDSIGFEPSPGADIVQDQFKDGADHMGGVVDKELPKVDLKLPSESYDGQRITTLIGLWFSSAGDFIVQFPFFQQVMVFSFGIWSFSIIMGLTYEKVGSIYHGKKENKKEGK